MFAEKEIVSEGYSFDGPRFLPVAPEPLDRLVGNGGHILLRFCGPMISAPTVPRRTVILLAEGQKYRTATPVDVGEAQGEERAFPERTIPQEFDNCPIAQLESGVELIGRHNPIATGVQFGLGEVAFEVAPSARDGILGEKFHVLKSEPWERDGATQLWLILPPSDKRLHIIRIHSPCDESASRRRDMVHRRIRGVRPFPKQIYVLARLPLPLAFRHDLLMEIATETAQVYAGDISQRELAQIEPCEERKEPVAVGAYSFGRVDPRMGIREEKTRRLGNGDAVATNRNNNYVNRSQRHHRKRFRGRPFEGHICASCTPLGKHEGEGKDTVSFPSPSNKRHRHLTICHLSDKHRAFVVGHTPFLRLPDRTHTHHPS